MLRFNVAVSQATYDTLQFSPAAGGASSGGCLGGLPRGRLRGGSTTACKGAIAFVDKSQSSYL